MLAVWNVLIVLWINVFLGQAEVNYVDRVVLVARVPTDEEVLRFDISVDKKLRMDVFHATNLDKIHQS